MSTKAAIDAMTRASELLVQTQRDRDALLAAFTQGPRVALGTALAQTIEHVAPGAVATYSLANGLEVTLNGVCRSYEQHKGTWEYWYLNGDVVGTLEILESFGWEASDG